MVKTQNRKLVLIRIIALYTRTQDSESVISRRLNIDDKLDYDALFESTLVGPETALLKVKRIVE